ncbi:vacuolar protein sorting-associated protein 26-domain-containing protein [Roridomyces roridus]|uniref:Vacuolar protein sorting-associated protein 26-domain-containing protein n=1 Tax=Roridomyces roridus TaxID=1738132 RepID=A0AAD7FRG6_9AGAR|nr:vacuolar protein sorting-associated protein 26-domain-containing protein [Roridomyces roridus]
MAAYFFAPPLDVETKTDKELETLSCPVYYDGDSVSGQVVICVRDGKRMQHDGIKVQFVGQICRWQLHDRGHHHEFPSLSQELAAPGEMRRAQTFVFNFKNVEKQFESYQGTNVKLRYFLRVSISRRAADVTKERVLYHLKDVIVGRIHFLLVHIKMKRMELSIIQKETTGSPPNQYKESQTITNFEIMDGEPVRGETIPIRIYLGDLNLTPTFRDINKKFSTQYYLHLVLIDEENRQYFQQQPESEIREKARTA